MTRYLLIFCFLADAAFARFIFYRPSIEVKKNLAPKTTINEFVDTNIRELRHILGKGLDPFNVPNITQNLGIGTLELSSIKLINMSTINRTGDVGIYDNIPNRNLTIDCSIGFAELQVSADFKASTWLGSPIGKLKARIPGIHFLLKVDFNFGTGLLSLASFNLTKNDKNMELIFDGDYQTIMNLFAGFITTFLGDTVVTVIAIPLNNAIAKIIDQINAFSNGTLNAQCLLRLDECLQNKKESVLIPTQIFNFD